jgi:predicted transcriptional regulator
MEETRNNVLEHTANIVSRFVGRNRISLEALPDFIQSVHTALANIGSSPAAPEAERVKLTSAQIRKSITPDHLFSFIDGKPYKSLRRHLTSNGFTLDSYKAHFGLSKDYPSVSPNCSAMRSAMAKAHGLGANRAAAVAVAKAKAPKAGLTPAEAFDDKPAEGAAEPVRKVMAAKVTAE